jgi:two-component system phosphate regulon sensor histidine kinase PhoR
MRLGLQWKWMVLFIFLLLAFLVIQGYLLYFLNKPFLLSSLLSLMILIPLVYSLTRSLTRPIWELAQSTIQLVSSIFNREVQVNSKDELGSLSRAVGEIGNQLRNKIEEISREKDYFQTILKGMTEGVLVVDGRGRITMINNALRNLLALSSDVADKMPLEVIRNAGLEAAIRKAIQDGKNMALEFTVPTPGRRTVEVNVVGITSSSQSVGGESEGARGAIAVFHDITRLKELERIRQDFVANVSHELRTPLTTIKGYAETLLEGALKEEIASQFVQVIKKHTDRLTQIVEDLLMLSKIESREFQLNLKPITVPDLFEDVLCFIREAAGKKDITIIQKEIPPSLIIQADRNYLEQVLINLLDNAIKYTSMGGEITISAALTDQEEIQISVEDNGIGIPTEDLPRIFERFYRVDKGRSQEVGGTGLGLSIVKHIIQAHGGRVWVKSQVRKGSTFYFTVPKKSVS